MTEVFAFEWCSCIYESGYSTVSLHSTKRGAVKAMVAETNDRWQERRNEQLVYGCGRKPRYDPLMHEAWRVAAIEVHNA